MDSVRFNIFDVSINRCRIALEKWSANVGYALDSSEAVISAQILAKR